MLEWLVEWDKRTMRNAVSSSVCEGGAGLGLLLHCELVGVTSTGAQKGRKGRPKVRGTDKPKTTSQLCCSFHTLTDMIYYEMHPEWGRLLCCADGAAQPGRFITMYASAASLDESWAMIQAVHGLG